MKKLFIFLLVLIISYILFDSSHSILADNNAFTSDQSSVFNIQDKLYNIFFNKYYDFLVNSGIIFSQCSRKFGLN